jgi:hypothetical protein
MRSNWMCLLVVSMALLLSRSALAEKPSGPEPRVVIDVVLVDASESLIKAAGFKPRSNDAAPNLEFGVLKPETLALVQDALKKHSTGEKILNHTKVHTLNNQACRINTCKQVCIPTRNEKNEVVQQARDVGAMLELCPTISADGKLTLDAMLHVSRLDGGDGITSPSGFVASGKIWGVRTQVESSSGETTAIAWPGTHLGDKVEAPKLLLLTPMVLTAGDPEDRPNPPSAVPAVAPGMLPAAPELPPAQVQIDVCVANMPEKARKALSMFGGSDPSNSQMSFAVIAPDEFKMLWKAIHGIEGVKILAEPKIITLSGKPAHFLSGGQVAVPILDGNKVKAVDYRNVGTECDFLPIVKVDKKIYLEANVRQRSANNTNGMKTAFGYVPGFDEQSVRTSAELTSGQTMVLCQPGIQTNSGVEPAKLILMTATLLPESAAPSVSQGAPVPAPSKPQRSQDLARQLVAEYQQAAAAGDKELAMRLARAALELDPLCFQKQIQK